MSGFQVFEIDYADLVIAEGQNDAWSVCLAELTLQLDGVKTKGMAPRWCGELRSKLG